MTSRADRRKVLEELKAARAGQRRQYKIAQDTKIYDTVSEEQYREIVKGRTEEDDFIENDGDFGYVDQGVDDWEQADSDKDSVERDTSKHRQSKSKSKPKPNSKKSQGSESRPEASRPTKSTLTNQIPTASHRPTTTLEGSSGLSAYRKVKNPVESDEFMNGLLSGLGPDNSSGKAQSNDNSVPVSELRKRKGAVTSSRGVVPNKFQIRPTRETLRNPLPSSSDVDTPISIPSSDTNDPDILSEGIGGGMSSEADEPMERQSKKPRVQTLHEDLIGLDVEDLAYDDDFDCPMEPLTSDGDDLEVVAQLIPSAAVDEDFQAKPLPHLHKPLHGPTLKNGTNQKPRRQIVNHAGSAPNAKGHSGSNNVTPVEPKPKTTATITKPKLQGLDWKTAIANVPISSNKECQKDVSKTTSESVDPASDPAPKTSKENPDQVNLSETTEFLANVPRMGKNIKAPSKRALAKAEADRHLPEPMKVDAFEPRVTSDPITPHNSGVEGADATEKGENLKFFWLDYLEVEGLIYLFGKVLNKLTSTYVTCCVIVEGMERNLFVLPRETIRDEDDVEVKPTEDDVYDDIEEVLQRHGISEFKAKVVKRKYCFEQKGIPPGEHEWHKVVYSFSKPAIPLNTKSRTFDKVLGTHSSAFELFLLKRRIMGPCWLNLRGALPNTSKTPASWCQLEVVVKNPKSINPFSDSDNSAPQDLPPMRIISLSVRDIMNHKENKRELVCATIRTWHDAQLEDSTPLDQQPSFTKTFVRPLSLFPAAFRDACRQTSPVIHPVTNEQTLLTDLLADISRLDPDIVVGYDLTSGALDVLLHRMRDLRTPHWSRIGRFRRDKLPLLRSGAINNQLTGRLLCDLSAEGFKSSVSSTTWSLTELCQQHLNIAREDIDPDEIIDYFDSTSTKPTRLVNFIKHSEADTYFQMALVHKVQYLSLTKQLTNLAGNSWNATLFGGRAQRNEYILLHEFHRQKFICPDKLSFNDRKAIEKAQAIKAAENDGEDSKKNVKKDKYKGGLVFEPKRGLWDKFILVMDFNSLYPSIIQEYNIDFTTIDRTSLDEDDPDAMPELPSSSTKQGILPRLIATLVNRRRQVKSLMKDRDTAPNKMIQYEIKQLALKLTANSMYGCLGFEGSRFYARSLAALTTYKGREILTNTRELAESKDLDVIYGDTDSVMINTNAIDFAAAKRIGGEFKKLVNERYRLLEIDIDAVFERMLLLQKKKYAALKIDEVTLQKSVEVKGLDMKRREFCKLSKDASQYILQHVLSGDPTEIVVEKMHEYLTQLGEDVKAGKKDLEDFIIHKKLGKNPKDYPDAKSQPHVQVALRMESKGSSAAKAGDVIPYIFCLGDDGSSSARSAQADKARHPDDLRRSDSTWKIDYDYYLSLQILPPIERLCEPIEGTDRSRLAECLGLDPSRFKTHTSSNALDNEREFHTLDSQIPDSERFKDSQPFKLRCRSCHEEADFKGAQADTSGMIGISGMTCPNLVCKQRYSIGSMAAQLEIQIRGHISKFYEAWLVCDDASCRNRTRMMSVYGRRCLNSAMACKGVMSYEYTDKMLYDQLLYYQSLFDPEKAMERFKGTDKSELTVNILKVNRKTLLTLKVIVDKHLEWNGRRYVSMGSLFSFMTNVKVMK